MSETIFSKIIDKQIPADIVYEDDLCLAFKDIQPVAPIHILVIPKKAIATLNAIEPSDKHLIGHMHCTVAHIAKKLGFAESGYRVVVNCNANGGQEVYHLHLHIIAGQAFGWPPFPSHS